MLSIALYKKSIILIPQPSKDTTSKESCRPIFHYDSSYKNDKQRNRQANQTAHGKDHGKWSGEFYLSNARMVAQKKINESITLEQK